LSSVGAEIGFAAASLPASLGAGVAGRQAVQYRLELAFEGAQLG
jgi:hypothetical protein